MNRTASIAGKSVRLTYNEPVAPQIEWLVGLLTRMEAARGVLADGARIELGWTMLLVRQAGGAFEILAPDFERRPGVDWTDDLTTSLEIQARQNDVLNRLSLAEKAEPVRFDSKIVLAKGVLAEHELCLQRDGDRSATDSGWFIGYVETPVEPATLEALEIYQLLKTRPEVLSALALPSGYVVVFHGSEIAAVLDESDVDVSNRAAGGSLQ